MIPTGLKNKKVKTKQKPSYQEAVRHLVGGVNSPVRAFKGVGGEPFLAARAKGSKIYDTRGKGYIDYVMSWGPHILGHGAPQIQAAARKQLARGTSYGAPTWEEVELAQLVKEAFPSIERVRFVSSGTEAAMSAARLARGFTGREKILKFEGCYHGHADSMLVKAGSGGATFGIPDSQGVPKELAKLTLTLPYNDVSAVEGLFRAEGKEIAAILVEPIAGNMGLVVPEKAFLLKLRELCSRYGSILVFDEVISGFRASFGGAQEFFGVKPDLTCLGKIIGAGLPMGAFGGRNDIMSKLAPEGPVYQAGTLSGNPLATACGLAMLKELRKRKIYAELEKKKNALVKPLKKFLADRGYPARINDFGSAFTVFFTAETVRDFETAKTSDTKKYAVFFHALLSQGIFFPPSQYETCFVSRAHSAADLERTRKAMERAFDKAFQP